MPTDGDRSAGQAFAIVEGAGPGSKVPPRRGDRSLPLAVTVAVRRRLLVAPIVDWDFGGAPCRED